MLVGSRYTSGPCELRLCPVVAAYTRYNTACSPLNAASFVMIACSNSRVATTMHQQRAWASRKFMHFPTVMWVHMQHATATL